MLYLRTGANGTCKTLFTLKDVREKQLKEGRSVCWNGRFDLKPEIAEQFGWKKIDFKDWQDQDDGTIFLIDECHNDMPKRPSGSPVPLHIKALGEHRKRGFDFFLITQHPSNIDTFVTNLVGAPGWHQHLKRIAGGSKMTSVLQWDAVNLGCAKNGSARNAQVKTRAHPKEVYGWYDSAELHTEKVRIPKTWLVIGAAVVLVPLMGWLGASTMWEATTGKAPKDVDGKPVIVAPGDMAPSVRVAPNEPARPKPLTVAEYAEAHEARFIGLPHTAPRYDEVTRPTVVPVPAACITSRSKGCRCYTQQGTLIPLMKPDVCAQIVESGFFLDFETGGQRSEALREGASSAPVSAPAQVQSDGIGPGEIAGLSRATTGNNIWARNPAKAASGV